MTEQEQMRDIALDALALICAAARGDAEGAATVLMTYTDPGRACPAQCGTHRAREPHSPGLLPKRRVSAPTSC